MRIVFVLFFCSSFLYGGVRDYVDSATASFLCAKGSYAEAQKCYERLLVENCTCSSAKRGLADCFYEQQNFDTASHYYEQLLHDPVLELKQQEEASFNQGCSYAQRKKYVEALKAFEKVVSMNKKHERAQHNIEILKKILEQQKQQQKQDQQKDQQDKHDQKNKDNQQNQDQSKNDDQKQEQKNQHDDAAKNGDDKKSSEQQKQGESQKQQRPDLDKERKEEKGKQDQQQGDKQRQDQSDKHNRQQDGGSKQQDTQKGQQDDKKQGNQNNNHDKTPCEKGDLDKDTTKKAHAQLDKQMCAILKQAEEAEKHGQHLYLQALAGQQDQEKGGAHDW